MQRKSGKEDIGDEKLHQLVIEEVGAVYGSKKTGGAYQL